MIEHLSRNEVQALGDMAALADSLGIRLMLIGANARRLMLTFPLDSNRNVPRKIGISRLRWKVGKFLPDFMMRQSLVQSANFVRENPHRIVHTNTAILLDLVPFGKLSEIEGQIRWPQSQQVMSVLGFEEAYECSARARLPNGLEIGIVTTPLLAALKIFAFSDRGDRFSRDLQDLWFIMERYARPPIQENRVFEELVELFPDESYYEHFSSLLLGWDIGRQCRVKTLAAMSPILAAFSEEGNQRIEPLLPGMGDLEAREAWRTEVISEFSWLRKGISLAAEDHV